LPARGGWIQLLLDSAQCKCDQLSPVRDEAPASILLSQHDGDDPLGDGGIGGVNAIYGYLSAVFDLVMWWKAEDRAISRARWTIQLQGAEVPITDEPFAAVIFCTADRQKVDRRTRSKWSRVMRYAAEYKTNAEPLATFVRRKGGINKCAARFTRCLGRRSRS
jgi:hypothetical protein